MNDLFSYAAEEQNETQVSSKENILTVTQLSNKLRMLVEGKFSAIAVEGEISGLKIATSGHIYFDLKDSENLVKSVVWRSSADRIKCKLEDGLSVVAHGNLTTYGARSNYQLIVTRMEPAGLGALMKRFEELKARLEAEGLFASERKKALPFIPEKIGIITSPTGTVIEDMLHRIRDRFPSHIMLYPALVRGVGAKEEIAAGFEYFNALPKANQPDVIIVARGGGSLEDLWAFNEEIVVRAIAASKIPVMSAIGHEPDVTLCDYVADLRAPTPTAAAEMVVPVRDDLVYTLKIWQGKLQQTFLQSMEMKRKNLQFLARGLGNPKSNITQARFRLDERSERFHNAISARLKEHKQSLNKTNERFSIELLQRKLTNLCEKLSEKEKRLLSVSPDAPLKRGYAYIKNKEGLVVRSKKELQNNNIEIQFIDGSVHATVNDVL